MATDLERLTVLIEANTRSYERSMLRLQQQTDKAIRGASKSIGGLEAAFAKAQRAALAFVSIGAFKQLASSVADTVHSAAALVDLADKIGITTDALQELHYQAEQNGSSAEALDSAMEQFSKRVGLAAAGSGELLKILQANGVALKDAAGNLRPLTAILADYADLIKNATDDQQRAVLTLQAFGKAGDEMAVVLRGGAADMETMAAAAHKLNQVVGEDGLRTLESYDDKMAELEGKWNTAWTEMTVIALTALEKIGQAEHFILDPVIDFLSNLKSAEQKAREAGAAAGDLIAGKGGTSSAINDRINQAFDVAAGVRSGGGGTTKLPPPAATAKAHDAAAAAIEREKKAVVELIAELERELSLVGATDEQRRISNELRDAGSVATEAQKQQIAALVTAIEAEELAQERLIDTLDEIRNASGSALDSFVQSIADSKGPLEAMKAALVDVLQTIIRIAEQQAITRLFGAAGTAGGGLFGAAIAAAPRIGSVAPARAAASQAMAVHITAEPSPLLNLTITKSSQAAEERAIARGPVVARNNNLRYAVP